MRSSFVAAAFCFAAASAAALAVQVPDPAALAGHGLVRVQAQGPADAQSGQRPTGATATDGQGRALPMDDGLPEIPRVAATAKPGAGDKQPRHAGPAMLLAALAVMAGIVLRRYGASVR